jgi:hypothetical protein
MTDLKEKINKILKPWTQEATAEVSKRILETVKKRNNEGFCEIEGCNEPAFTKSDYKSITDLEFIDNLLPGKKYCWARFGVMNARLCKKHFLEALENCLGKLREKK